MRETASAFVVTTTTPSRATTAPMRAPTGRLASQAPEPGERAGTDISDSPGGEGGTVGERFGCSTARAAEIHGRSGGSRRMMGYSERCSATNQGECARVARKVDDHLATASLSTTAPFFGNVA